MTDPTSPAGDDSDDDVGPTGHGRHDGAPIPRPRPGYRTPEPAWSLSMSAWAPVVASCLRAITGVIAFVASLLAMPLHFATPFMVGVSLVMTVGGCTATLKVTRDDPRLRGFGRFFTIAVVVVILVALGVAGVMGPGVFAPDIMMEPLAAPAPVVDDGTIRFEVGP